MPGAVHYHPMDWAVAIVVALLALSGVLVGDILQRRSANETLKENRRLEQERWNREDQRRHEDARHQAYPSFLAVADEGVLGLSDHLRDGRSPTEPFAGPGWDQRLRESLAVIEFVGSPQTIETAQLLYRAVQRLRVGALGVLELVYQQAGGIAGAETTTDFEHEPGPDAARIRGEGTPAGDEDNEAKEVDGAHEREGFREGMTLPEFMDFVEMLPYPWVATVHRIACTLGTQ